MAAATSPGARDESSHPWTSPPQDSWGYELSNESQGRLAWIKDGVTSEGPTFLFDSPSLCRMSAPVLSASGHRVLGSVRCSDGTAYLFGETWAWRGPGAIADLPAVALNESGSLGLAAWTEGSGQGGALSHSDGGARLVKSQLPRAVKSQSHERAPLGESDTLGLRRSPLSARKPKARTQRAFVRPIVTPPAKAPPREAERAREALLPRHGESPATRQAR